MSRTLNMAILILTIVIRLTCKGRTILIKPEYIKNSWWLVLIIQRISKALKGTSPRSTALFGADFKTSRLIHDP